tara:strand:- start:815 stop:1006 length:192 start_codon:yes stop_codon:yes gene_type:complete
MATYGKEQRDSLTKTHHKANIEEAIGYMGVIEVLEQCISASRRPKELKRLISIEKLEKAQNGE